MSEPIQSISQGNYILQGTVATSAGIVGDGTTQNPLRADETVLWSGTPGTNSTGTLSEPVWNFERFKMYINSLHGGDYVCEFSPTGTNTARNFITYGPRGNNDCSFDMCKWTFTENTFSAVSAKSFHSTWTATAITVENNQAAAKGYVSRIVGINRIAE